MWRGREDMQDRSAWVETFANRIKAVHGMSDGKFLLGKIFISHSSVDKPFVRRLSEAIEEAGFETWLDEKELIPGDPLAQRISEALDKARVVLVVVSSASIASPWLSFELNKATARMVKVSAVLFRLLSRKCLCRLKLPDYCTPTSQKNLIFH